MRKKLTITLALAAVGCICLLGYVKSQWPANEFNGLTCAAWHDMKITTNTDKIRQNTFHTDNGWIVTLDAFNLPDSIKSMEVEVCKICGKATMVRIFHTTE